ncbi:hypothetical protein VOLCADRAFT_92607 [Volvox carteri f. nagariensis]|uniref:Uncharacterized protein n=1 Tax=Volvox carteri f. nagariensis TaxID=3068 RepID=D8U033_VOLCA|nr:uncharacterized protein VOLCADRAFT_92607 [Volvox carteri f. nagariensis]EFJ46796.1 hypothetical protein VOLCADRAFT_92607 [Volvox carteri f. nagariensis]|eukprot:XP_002952005.1 hypothetical protein VOLCADRAFT_92607 [Volvox carteri f. nagariensis]
MDYYQEDTSPGGGRPALTRQVAAPAEETKGASPHHLPVEKENSTTPFGNTNPSSLGYPGAIRDSWVNSSRATAQVSSATPHFAHSAVTRLHLQQAAALNGPPAYRGATAAALPAAQAGVAEDGIWWPQQASRGDSAIGGPQHALLTPAPAAGDNPPAAPCSAAAAAAGNPGNAQPATPPPPPLPTLPSPPRMLLKAEGGLEVGNITAAEPTYSGHVDGKLAPPSPLPLAAPSAPTLACAFPRRAPSHMERPICTSLPSSGRPPSAGGGPHTSAAMAVMECGMRWNVELTGPFVQGLRHLSHPAYDSTVNINDANHTQAEAAAVPAVAVAQTKVPWMAGSVPMQALMQAPAFHAATVPDGSCLEEGMSRINTAPVQQEIAAPKLPPALAPDASGTAPLARSQGMLRHAPITRGVSAPTVFATTTADIAAASAGYSDDGGDGAGGDGNERSRAPETVASGDDPPGGGGGGTRTAASFGKDSVMAGTCDGVLRRFFEYCVMYIPSMSTRTRCKLLLCVQKMSTFIRQVGRLAGI